MKMRITFIHPEKRITEYVSDLTKIVYSSLLGKTLSERKTEKIRHNDNKDVVSISSDSYLIFLFVFARYKVRTNLCKR